MDIIYKIYKITNKINNKIYVGVTMQELYQRFNDHCTSAVRNDHDFKFSRAIRKYGKENFSMDLICECSSKEDAFLTEKNMIKHYNSIIDGYNTHECGQGGHTGAYHKVGKSGPENPMWGKKTSEEAKAKIREKIRLWRLTDAGQAFTEASKERIAKVNSGKSMNEETKRKMIQSKKGKPNIKSRKIYEVTCPDGQKVICVGFSEITEKLNLNRNGIRHAFYRGNGIYKGYHIKIHHNHTESK